MKIVFWSIFFLILVTGLILIIYFLSSSKIISNFKYKNSNFKFDENNKLKIFNNCKYGGYDFNQEHELGECSIANQIIPLVKNVLEIGGGAGKVSHMINYLLKKRGLNYKHVVVEPGEKGVGNHKNIIYKNKELFNDNYTIIAKFAENLNISDLKTLDYRPDCLYVDCEGCLHKFLNTDIGRYCLKSARFIINENDSHVIKKDIQELRDLFTKSDFSKVAVGYGCGTNCDTEIWYKNKKL